MKQNFHIFLLTPCSENLLTPSPIENGTQWSAKQSITKRRNRIKPVGIFLSILLICISQLGFAQTNTWDGSSNANWNTAANWSLNHVPLVAEDVVIPDGITATISVDVAAVCKSFSISGGGTSNTVSINAGQSLTVTNGITIGAPTSGNRVKILAVGSGTLSCASITMAATSNDSRDCEVTVSTGTINVSGNITMDGSSARNAVRFSGAGVLNIGGNFLGVGGGILVPSTGTVNCNGANAQLISGLNTSSFYNLTINKTAAANTVTSTTYAFTVANNLTVTQGNLILQATNANYTVTNDVNVAANGTITHSVNWDLTARLFSVGGNFDISGYYLYTTRAHVQMISAATKNISTGPNATSAFSLLTLKTGSFKASNTLRVNDNFWAMYNTTGSFYTNGQAVYANASLYNGGGTVFVDGGSLNVTGGLVNGNTTNGTVNVSAGTVNTDALTIGSGATGTFVHSGGTVNVNGNVQFTTGTYTCSGSPAINITGDWINNINAAAFVPASSTLSFTSTTANQSVRGLAVSQTLGNVTVNKGAFQLNASGLTTSLSLTGALTLTSGVFTHGTALAVNVAGNWINNGGTYTPGLGTITLNGSSAQSITGTAVTSFGKLTINNASGVNLSAVNTTVSGGANALTLTNGRINTGANKVILPSGTTISGASATKYINGNLQINIPTGSPSRVFEIGNASGYTPVTLSFTGVTVAGDVTANSTAGDHPFITSSDIDEFKSVNHYWNFANSGVVFTSYNATFNFPAASVDAGANTATFTVAQFGSWWTNQVSGTMNPTNSTATGITEFGDFAIGEGGVTAPYILTQPTDQSVCAGQVATFTAEAAAKPDPTVDWEISTDGGATFNTLTIASPYSVTNTSVAGITTSVLTINPADASLDGYLYRAYFSNSRGNDITFDVSLSVATGATVDAGPAIASICGSVPTAPLGGSVGGSATGGVWSTPAGGTFTPDEFTLDATWTPPVGFSGVATLTLTTTGGSCAAVAASKNVTVFTDPVPVTIDPASADICLGAIQSLSVTNSTQTTISSGTVNLAIPDNLAAGVTSTIAFSGIPAGATINSINVEFNINHNNVGDLILNLRAPNGNILNLVNRKGGTGNNFTNTIASSTGVTLFSSGAAPFTDTYKADGVNAVGATGQVSNVTAFSSLFSTPNGNWVFSARDAASVTAGTIANWSITIDWTEPVTWTPVTGLYTDAGATVPYVAGQNYKTVYAKPAVSGSTDYVAALASGCTSTQTVTVTAGPVVTITADYCYGGGFIQLTANSTPDADSWLWNTGETSQSILVDIAGLYQATATTAGGCVATGSTVVAQELVVNGDFSAGNTGFTSSYGYVLPTVMNGLYPESKYTVNSNPNFNHNNFWGRDHTSNTGNLMIINGAGSPVTVWQQTLTVTPNTTYYFSAWAISLNNVAPFAQLQFDINGTAIGTTAVLAAGPTNNNPPYNWIRFYGNWTSGPGVTSVTLSIKDLQTALGGNDFGLDDISFGSLGTFITRTSVAGTDTQTVCKNAAITPITYAVGGGAGGPTVTGLPPGINTSFVSGILTLSGSPTTVGVYDYTVETTGGCNPAYAYGRITVTEDTLTRTSAAGTDAQDLCMNTAITPITYYVGHSASGASVTGLPAGVTSSFSNHVLTISGTPTVAGTFNYTVTATGGCTSLTATGSIISRKMTIVRTSAPGTNTQTLCINTAIVNVTYSIGGTATGAYVTGLPAGLTGVYNAGVFTISGTPTVAGVFNYTVWATGTCAQMIAGGWFNVKAQSITLSSAPGTNAQSVCQNAAITNITYALSTAVTGATVAGLPAGVSGVYSAGLFTISGTPTVSGVFNYTVTTSGTCTAGVSANGTITVGVQTISLSSASGTNAQTKCINTAITNITYSVGGMATGASASGLPAGVTGSYSAGVFTISGTPTVAGVFNYTVNTSGSCSSPASASGTITVDAAAVGGTIASVSVCSGASGSLTLSGYTGTIVRWEYSTNNGSSWTNIVNTTNTQTYTNVTQAVLYRALVQNGSCVATAYSNNAKVGIHNLWTGSTSSDWNTVTNWSDDQLPSTSCDDVMIPALTAPNVYPQLTSGTATIKNLVIQPTATLTISGATLEVAGTITNNGVMTASNGTINLNGTAAQSIAGSMFQGKAIKNLVISNSSGVSFTGTNDTLKITGTISFGTSNATLNTNNNLTLVSNASGTASVADMTSGGLYSGNNITGNATVERYIPNHPKAWHFLAAPTTGQTINQSWQEGNAPLANTRPGYGTIITSNVSGAVSLGFDVYTASGPSMKTFNANTNGWDGVASPQIPITNQKGYMFFVRGDRSVTTSTAPSNGTILRTTGKLFTIGADAPPVTTVQSGKFESIGNPYASAIDFTLIGKPAAPAVDDVFYVWDPLLTNNYNGLGGYQTISAANGWKPVPGGTLNYDANIAYPYIRSGQAFLVHATGAGGNITFSETCKASGIPLVNRFTDRIPGRQYLRASMFNASGFLSDGNVVALDDIFSNDCNTDDALKVANSSENFGIIRGGKTLSVEARKPLAAEDTIFYNIASLRRQNYKLKFVPENLDNPGMTALLVDKYLNTMVNVSLTDSTVHNFTVNTDAASAAPDRFYIVFKTFGTLPVNITSISAGRNSDKTTSVKWNVENETSMQKYTVERSADGRDFTGIITADPTANNGGRASYQVKDMSALSSDNFYRIRALSLSGQVQYSAIVKVAPLKTTSGISVYPNPVTGKTMQLQFDGQPAGKYSIMLVHHNGMQQQLAQLQVNEGQSNHAITLPQVLASGMYNIKVIGEGSTTTLQVIYQDQE